MYKEYFGLAEVPFRITPDPRYLWFSEQHTEARDKILYHIHESAGPIVLIADIGTGKSTLARRIAEVLAQDESKKVVVGFAPKLTTQNAFLRFVMDEFEVKTERAYDKSLRNFQNFLVEQYQRHVSPVLLVDEAQNMNRDMLLLIQHLFNFSTNTEFLIQIAMFAQPDMLPRLNRLPSLKSRLNIAQLKAFDLEQTRKMLAFRWTVADGSGFPFSPGAVEAIYKHSRGIPRYIVKLANEALIKTAVDGKKTVSQAAVAAVSGEIFVDTL
jgi:general secretion pathway protein A